MEITALIHINTLLEREKAAAEEEYRSAAEAVRAYHRSHDSYAWDDDDANAPDELRALLIRKEQARDRSTAAGLALSDWRCHDWH